MEEQPLRPLENSRFAPTPESRTEMRFMVAQLPELQRQIPEIVGVGFCGSRTLGQERQLPENPSDFDVVIYWDGTELLLAKKVFPYLFKGSDIRHAVQPIMEQRGLPTSDIGQTVIPVDISQKATDQFLQAFIADTDELEKDNRVRSEWLTLDDPIHNLVSRFYLAVGDKVYANRTYILDTFEQMEKDGKQGEKYFGSLMEALQVAERLRPTLKREGVPQYEHYPQSIAEARKYFLVKPTL